MKDTSLERAPGVVESHQRTARAARMAVGAFFDREFFTAGAALFEAAVSSVVWGERTAQFIRTYTAESETMDRYPFEKGMKMWQIAEAMVYEQAVAPPSREEILRAAPQEL